MRLSAPKKNVWWLSVILAILGVLGTFITIPFVSAYTFWFLLVAYVLIFLGTVLKGF